MRAPLCQGEIIKNAGRWVQRAVKFLFSFQRIILSTILYHHYYSLLGARWSRASVSTEYKDKQTRWFIGEVVKVVAGGAGGVADRLDNNATVTVDFIPSRVFIFCYQIIDCLVIDLHQVAPCQHDGSQRSPRLIFMLMLYLSVDIWAWPQGRSTVWLVTLMAKSLALAYQYFWIMFGGRKEWKDTIDYLVIVYFPSVII